MHDHLIDVSKSTQFIQMFVIVSVIIVIGNRIFG